MKNWIIILVALIGFNTNAQTAEEFMVDGIKTIFQPSVKNVVSVQLFIDGGTANYAKDKEGVEALALDLVTQGGTTNNPKTQFFGKLDKMGSSIGSSVNYDYSTISLKCLDKSFDDSWALFADAINNPAFDAKEFENSKGQLLAGAQQSESDPDSHLRNMAMKNAFAGMNYEKIPQGSATAIETLTLDDVKQHYADIIGKDKVTLVIIGKLDKADLEQKISAAFKSMKANGKKAATESKMQISNSTFNSETRDIATNYIRGYMNAPSVGTRDEVALRLAMSILRDRLFQELRTKRNLTYAPGAFFPSGIIHNPYLALYVSTDKPNESAQVMMDELRKIKTEGFTDKELFDKKGQFVTRHYLQQETNGGLAASIGQASLSPGGLQHRENFIGLVEELNATDLTNAFKKYTNAINWTYLGDPSIVDQDVFLSSVEVLETVKVISVEEATTNSVKKDCEKVCDTSKCDKKCTDVKCSKKCMKKCNKKKCCKKGKKKCCKKKCAKKCKKQCAKKCSKDKVKVKGKEGNNKRGF